MDSLSDLSKYQELRKRIIRNEELSDNDWELFFELEMKNREIKQQKETWDNLFASSVLLPEPKRIASVKSNLSLKSLITTLSPVFIKKYQYAYAGLIIFFLIGFISYSTLTRKDAVSPVTSIASVDEKQSQEFSTPIEKKIDTKKDNNDLLVYAENPLLENYISDAVRSASNTIEITSPQSSLRYQLKEGTDTLNLSFNGTLLTDENPNGSVLLKIFSNKTNDYSNDLPLYNDNIEFIEKDAIFLFAKRIRHPLKKGLYYFTIEDIKNDEILYLNKFYIY